jgi:hypothetical protein
MSKKTKIFKVKSILFVMKKSVVVLVLVLGVLLTSSFVLAFFHKKPDLAPTDVGVTVNAPPTVTSITVDGDLLDPLDFDAEEDVDLTAGGTREVNVEIVIDDADNNLDDGSVTAQFDLGGVFRPAAPQLCTCFASCGTAPTTYRCATTDVTSIGMEYHDDNDVWTVTITAADDLGAVPSAGLTDTFDVNLLKDISLVGAGTPISYGTVSSPDSDIPSVADLEITNNGNYDTTGGGAGDGFVQIEAFDLHGDTITAEVIQSENFEAGEGDGTGCVPGDPPATTLGLDGSTTNIGNLALPRGDGTGGNNIGNMESCLRTVPGFLSSQSFSARDDHPECIAFGTACAWNVILPL